MNINKTYIGAVLFLGAALAFAGQTGDEWSPQAILDTRTSFGATVVHGGSVYVSPRNNSDTSSDVSFKVDGKTASGWSVSNPYWNSTSVTDGIHSVSNGKSLAVLNDEGVSFHGGILEQDETWGANSLHLVQYSLRVPSGVTLTISEDAIVKFCDDTQLVVDDGGKLVVGNATFTHIADDTVGGDSNLDGTASAPYSDAYAIIIHGTVTPNGNPDIRYLTPSAKAKLYTLTTSNCTSDRTIYFAGASIPLLTTPIPNWPKEENVVNWSSSPSSTIAKDPNNRFAAILTMRAANTRVTATVTKQQFKITTINCTVDETPQTPEETVTLTAIIPEGKEADDYLISWSTSPNVSITQNDDGTVVTFTMPHRNISVTCNLTQYEITTDDNCTASLDKTRPGKTVTLTAIIPEGEPPEEYTVEWGSEPEVDIVVSATDHTQASLVMPNFDVAVNCTVTRKTYTLTVVDGVAIQDGTEYTEIDLAMGETVTISSVQYDIEQWTRMTGWSTEYSEAELFGDAESNATTLTMPNTPITVTATYEPMPYMAEDTDHNKSISFIEYLQVKDAMKSHLLEGDLCITDENGGPVYISNAPITSGSEGDYVRRTIQQQYYAEGSAITVTFDFQTPVELKSFILLENIPEGWHWKLSPNGSLGSGNSLILDLDYIKDENDNYSFFVWTLSDASGSLLNYSVSQPGIPTSISYTLYPNDDASLGDAFTLEAEAIGCIGDAYLEVSPANTPLERAIPFWADTDKDLVISSNEIDAAREKLIDIILHGGGYVWDGTDFVPYPLVEGTRGTEKTRGALEVARQVSSESFDLGSLVTVTLELPPVSNAAVISLQEYLPQNWLFVESSGGQLSKDGSSLFFDFDVTDSKPARVFYTLKAPTLYAEPAYALVAGYCRLISNTESLDVHIPDTQLQWANPMPSLTVYASGNLAQWRVNSGEWLESGTPVSVAQGTLVSLEIKLPDDQVKLDKWMPLDDTVTFPTPGVPAFSMSGNHVSIKARLVSPKELALKTGWNLLCKTTEMASSGEFDSLTVTLLSQEQYRRHSFVSLPLGKLFWLYAKVPKTITLYHEAVKNASNYHPAGLTRGWQTVGSPDARLNCVVNQDDAEAVFAWREGKWQHLGSQDAAQPLDAEQGCFLFK